jgi:hypothetical protein
LLDNGAQAAAIEGKHQSSSCCKRHLKPLLQNRVWAAATEQKIEG